MDATHLHLLLTHFPIIGSLIATVLLLIAIWKKSSTMQEVALLLMVSMALIAIPVFTTGEPAEESVENLPGVVESIIEAHEEAGELAFWVMMTTGALALAAVVIHRMRLYSGHLVVYSVFIMGMVTSGLMARTGYLGGQIRHTEIRSGNATGQILDTGNPGTDQNHDDGDD